MRKLIICLFLLASPGLAMAASEADAITGIWLNTAEGGYIQVYQTDSGTYAAQVVGAEDGAVRDDVHNPDPAERDESLLGQDILHGFTYDGAGSWVEGRAYDPESGETYDAWMALTDDGRLKIHGYVMFSLFGVTKYLTRVEPSAKGVVESVLVATPNK